jgi:hypothetical protein
MLFTGSKRGEQLFNILFLIDLTTFKTLDVLPGKNLS